MLVYFQCLTHTAVYANLYVCAPNTRGGPKAKMKANNKKYFKTERIERLKLYAHTAMT